MDHGTLEVRNIEKAYWNGKDVKVFDIFEWDEAESMWVFYGQHSAPIRTANKNLLNYLEEKYS